VRIEVKLPQLGEDEPGEAAVSFWHIDVGETVNEGEDLVAMVTDKATFNVPSPARGTLVEIRADEGDTVQVGGILGILETGP